MAGGSRGRMMCHGQGRNTRKIPAAGRRAAAADRSCYESYIDGYDVLPGVQAGTWPNSPPDRRSTHQSLPCRLRPAPRGSGPHWVCFPGASHFLCALVASRLWGGPRPNSLHGTSPATSPLMWNAFLPRRPGCWSLLPASGARRAAGRTIPRQARHRLHPVQ